MSTRVRSVIVPVLEPVHTGMVSYRSEAFRAKKSKRKYQEQSAILPISVNLAVLRLRSHGNDIVELSYRSDFWNGKVDCSHGSGP